MTAPSKIHQQAAGKPEGVTVCGRKPGPGRLTTDPDKVTCDVCIVTALRQDPPPRPRGRGTKTVVDRLTEGRGTLDLTGDDPARSAATKTLVSRHLEEFLELYRDELTKAGR